MKKLLIAIHGFGNIGKTLVEVLSITEDMECLGLIRRQSSMQKEEGVLSFTSVEELEQKTGKRPDIILLSLPSKSVPELAAEYVRKGYSTVDSFDIHKDISNLVKSLDPLCKSNDCVAISAAGWDPGSNSVLRALFEAMAPTGVTFTNFGPGRSMGHSVAARSVSGVKDAISLTMPLGGGRHARIVYVLAEEGAKEDDLRRRIKEDSYFCNDDLDVRFVPSQQALSVLADNSHGVLLERYGASGLRSNQHLQFNMRIDNPALTAQVMVSCARAAKRLSAGSYTMIDIPPVYLLAGERFDHIARFV